MAYDVLGQYKEASEAYESSSKSCDGLGFDRNYIDFLFFCPDNTIRSREKALLIASDGSRYEDLSYAAKLYATEGRFDEAVRLLERARNNLLSIVNPRAQPGWLFRDYSITPETISRSVQNYRQNKAERLECWDEKPIDWPWAFPDVLSRDEWLKAKQWNREFPDTADISLPFRSYYILNNVS